MIALIDTNSLLAFVRYFLPFDADGKMLQAIQNQVGNGKLCLIDAVRDQAKYVSGRAVSKGLPFLFEREAPVADTSALIADTKFIKRLKSDLHDHDIRRRHKMSDTELDREVNDYLKEADCKLLLYARHWIQQNPDSQVCIVTEETAYANDGKLFKKIPAMCSLLGIDSCNLPAYLARHFELSLSVSPR